MCCLFGRAISLNLVRAFTVAGFPLRVGTGIGSGPVLVVDVLLLEAVGVASRLAPLPPLASWEWLGVLDDVRACKLGVAAASRDSAGSACGKEERVRTDAQSGLRTGMYSEVEGAVDSVSAIAP